MQSAAKSGTAAASSQDLLCVIFAALLAPSCLAYSVHTPVGDGAKCVHHQLKQQQSAPWQWRRQASSPIGLLRHQFSVWKRQNRGPCRPHKANPLADQAAGFVQKSKRLQRGLLVLAVLGTSMTIGDGVMTAAASGSTIAKRAMLKSSLVMYAQSCHDQHSLTAIDNRSRHRLQLRILTQQRSAYTLQCCC